VTTFAIDLEAVGVRAGGRELLDLPAVRLDSRRLTAVMGPNGAGKTTLMRLCLGLVQPWCGRVRVLGQSVDSLSGGALSRLRRRIGYVPQLLPVPASLPLTVREVVAMGRSARAGLFRSLGRDDWRIVDGWLDRMGLLGLAEQAFGRLSGGEQRKGLIARAMVQEPELLLLDEPTANLDLGWRERMVGTVEALFREGKLTVVLVCHELEVLPPSCERVVLLDRGRLVTMGTPEEVFTGERVSGMYGTELWAIHRGVRHAVVPRELGHA